MSEVKLIDSGEKTEEEKKAEKKKKRFEKTINIRLGEIGLELDIDDFITSVFDDNLDRTYRINEEILWFKRKVGLLTISTNRDYLLVSLSKDSVLEEFKEVMEEIASDLNTDIHIVYNMED